MMFGKVAVKLHRSILLRIPRTTLFKSTLTMCAHTHAHGRRLIILIIIKWQVWFYTCVCLVIGDEMNMAPGYKRGAIRRVNKIGEVMLHTRVCISI